MGVHHAGDMVIHCDNQSVIAIAKNLTLHGRSKHIDVRFHFIRKLVADELIQLVHCSTNDQQADLLTKGLPTPKHEYMCSLLGIEGI